MVRDVDPGGLPMKDGELCPSSPSRSRIDRHTALHKEVYESDHPGTADKRAGVYRVVGRERRL